MLSSSFCGVISWQNLEIIWSTTFRGSIGGKTENEICIGVRLMQFVDHVGQFFVLYITRSGERFFVLISSCSQENDGGVYMKARCKRLVELFFVVISCG